MNELLSNLFSEPPFMCLLVYRWLKSPLFHIVFRVNKSYTVNRRWKAAAEHRPEVRRSWRLQKMLDFGEVVDLVTL